MFEQTKRELPYAEIEISFQPHHPADCEQILEWMAIENQRAIQAGLDKLYFPISKKDFKKFIPQQKMLFFYWQNNLLGFVRIYELQIAYWEIMSAISNPTWRKFFTGFNKLFQQKSLLQIEKLSKQRSQRIKGIFIVTYHPAVSASIEKMILTSVPFYWQQYKFDFSAMKKLTTDEIIRLHKILRISLKEIKKSFVFELKNCIQMIDDLYPAKKIHSGKVCSNKHLTELNRESSKI